ncbi:MAG: ribose-phosphate pyrophosphokinase [Bdellovibrionaceae bacterium]|nr:ribose-phosphate pyrophosphokinase [Pseudobdellovibrionaceae bacterium]MDW8190747.1 ribose-phosphate pyrophosphokinase [Pseudobdellovibrionaceae bacterium]
MMEATDIKLFCGNSHPQLAAKIAELLKVPLGKARVSRFADGEVQVEIHESVRGHHVYLVQSTCPPANENYMELFIMIDALKRASPASITAVIPYYGYARQDRKVAPRAPITAKLMADLLAVSGIHRMVSIDLHAGQIQGFFNVPVDHLYAIPTFSRYWREHYGYGPEFVAVSPDAGGVERAKAFAKRIECSISIIDKRRTSPNEAKAVHLIGDVKNKTAIIVDDMIDTAGTLTEGVDILYRNGAKRVLALATHPVFSGPALGRIQESGLEKVFVTDTIPLSKAAQSCNKIEVISVAPLLAEAIQRIHGNISVSSLFE